MKFKNRTAILDQHEQKQLASVTANISTLATLAKTGTRLHKELTDASNNLKAIESRGDSIDLDAVGDKQDAVAGTVGDKKTA